MVGTTPSDIYEIVMAYKRITMDMPIHIGINILLLSKLRVLEFAYSFIDYFIPRHLYDPVLMDTDSFYMQIAGREIEDVVRPELLAEYRERLENFHGEQRHPKAFLPRTCCQEHAIDDDKQYYLFKCEMRASVVVALTSKTYCCLSLDGEYKLTAKGANKKSIKPAAGESYSDIYKQVLDKKEPRAVTNRGFMMHRGVMKTYEVDRDVFPFVYFKRELVKGQYHTLAYEHLTLEAYPKTYLCIPTDLYELSMDYEGNFIWREWMCSTIRQAVCLLKKLYCREVKDCQPVDRDIPTTRTILTTTRPRKLHQMMHNMGPCPSFTRELYPSLLEIVKASMTLNADFKKDLLTATGDQPLINCCIIDPLCGNGRSAEVTRWKPGAYKEGSNLLGHAYMTIRDTKNTYC